jgi:threonine synthase
MRMACRGCGAQAALDDPHPFRCPNADAGGDVDHVLHATGRLELPVGDDPNPFVRFRELLYSYHFARRAGMRDAEYVEIVRDLDRAIAGIDGHGFTFTPFTRGTELGADLGLEPPGGLWIKDETGNVAGSHKARHLMAVAIQLAVAERLDMEPEPRAALAIASCGNAALAAAVLARAAGRDLAVYVPTWADGEVIERLHALGARVVACERRAEDPPGDPCAHRFRSAVREGALPFTVQGPENGVALEGGQTLGWEILAQRAEAGSPLLELTSIQVGGGALASSLWEATLRASDVHGLGRIHAVQTAGVHPLERAWSLVAAGVRARLGISSAETPREAANRMGSHSLETHAELAHASRNRSRYMRPWEKPTGSIATGILDDETYDWLDVVLAMTMTRGRPVIVDEATLEHATSRARTLTGIPVSPTGAAGLAGLYALARSGELLPSENTLVVFTGVR